MSDPFARPSSRTGTRRLSNDYSASSGSPSLSSGSLRTPLPPLSSLRLDTPIDFNAPVTLAPLTNPLPRPNPMRRRPSFSRTSSAYPSTSLSSSTSTGLFSTPLSNLPPSRRSVFDAEAPTIESTRARMAASAMQLDSSSSLSLSPLRSTGLPAFSTLDLASPPLRPASTIAGSSSNLSASPGSDDDARSHVSRGLRKYTKRTTFSHAQLEVMERLWRQTEYPNMDQLEVCGAAAGLTAKQVRTWFGNTRQARLAGTRREARHAGIPGVPGSSSATRSLTAESLSTLNQLDNYSNWPPCRVPITVTPELPHASIPPPLATRRSHRGLGSTSALSPSSGMPPLPRISGPMMSLEDDLFKAPRAYPSGYPGTAPLPSGSRSRRQSFAGYGGASGPPDLSFGLSSSSGSSSSANSYGSPGTRTTAWR